MTNREIDYAIAERLFGWKCEADHPDAKEFEDREAFGWMRHPGMNTTPE